MIIHSCIADCQPPLAQVRHEPCISLDPFNKVAQLGNISLLSSAVNATRKFVCFIFRCNIRKLENFVNHVFICVLLPCLRKLLFRANIRAAHPPKHPWQIFSYPDGFKEFLTYQSSALSVFYSLPKYETEISRPRLLLSLYQIYGEAGLWGLLLIEGPPTTIWRWDQPSHPP